MKTLERLMKEDEGQDVVEYALLAAFISIFAIVTIRAIGPLVNQIYTNIQVALLQLGHEGSSPLLAATSRL
jgi:Flp pilus assembly pilin Flp